jgi:hypothetical protein
LPLEVLFLRQLEPLDDPLHVGHVSSAEAQFKTVVESVLVHRLILLENSPLNPPLLMVPDLPFGLTLNPFTDKLVRLDTVRSKFTSTESALDAGLLICLQRPSLSSFWVLSHLIS